MKFQSDTIRVSFGGQVAQPTIQNVSMGNYLPSVMQAVADSIVPLYGLPQGSIKVQIGGGYQYVNIIDLFSRNQHFFIGAGTYVNPFIYLRKEVPNAVILNGSVMCLNRNWLEGEISSTDVDFLYNVVAHEVGHKVVAVTLGERVAPMWNEIFADFIAGITFALDQDNNPSTRDLNPNVPIQSHDSKGSEDAEDYSLDGTHPHGRLRAAIFRFGWNAGCNLRTHSNLFKDSNEVKALLLDFGGYFYNWFWNQYNNYADFKQFVDTMISIGISQGKNVLTAKAAICPPDNIID